MKTVFFIIEGDKIVKVINRSIMTNELIDSFLKVFIDLGWIITEVKTVGYFQLAEDDSSVKIKFKLTENDGNVDVYELEEDNFSSSLNFDEVVESTKKIGFMSNLSQA